MRQEHRSARYAAHARAAFLGAWVGGLAGLACAALPASAETKTSASTASTAAKTIITEEQATAAALKVMPGKPTGVSMEKKRGKKVYVVEIMTETQGEKDVLIDMVSGKVLGIE